MAPQNEAPIHSEPTAATTPNVVELSRMRVNTSVSVCCSTFGNRRCRSSRMLVSTSVLRSTWPKMKRTRSTNGKTASSRL